MVQLFYGTFLTEGVREGKLSALTVSSRLVTVSVLVEKAFESGISKSEYWFYLLVCVQHRQTVWLPRSSVFCKMGTVFTSERSDLIV